MSKGNWGADTTDERKPTWPWVAEYIGYANCFASGGGWTVRWPWGDEVIVALSNLTTKLGTANEAGLAVYALPAAGYLVNSAAQSLQVLVEFNEAVTVSGVPTLSLISATGAANGGNPANVALSYNASVSDLTAGRVVFGNNTFSMAAGGYGGDSLVANSSSIVANWDTIEDAGSTANVANGIPAALSLTIPVYQAVPIQTLTLRAGTAQDTVNQAIGFELDFNQALTITGTPFVIAIGPNTGIANTKLSYVAASSNTANGQLVFKSAANLDFSALTGNCAFTLTTNGASVNTTDGWTGIVGPAPVLGVVLHAIVVANTFTVVQNEPFLATTAAGANVTNAAARTITFGITFDRAVLVNTSIATPTVLAISNGASANVSLAYVSGSGSANLVFSSAPQDYTLAANEAFFVNDSSTITGFGAISNTGIVCSLTGVLTGAVSNHTFLVSA